MIDLENKKAKIAVCAVLIIFTLVCIGFCIYKLTSRDDVIYVEENADTGFGPSYQVADIRENVIKVDVEGAVRKPGLKVLKGDDKDRLDDAIKAAGGYSKFADTSQINLAMRINDGMKIVVPVFGEELRIENGVSSADGEEIITEKINVNTASYEELQKIPGIGPAYAQRIVEYRTSFGAFRCADDMLAIKGIGKKKLAKMKNYIKF